MPSAHWRQTAGGGLDRRAKKSVPPRTPLGLARVLPACCDLSGVAACALRGVAVWRWLRQRRGLGQLPSTWRAVIALP